MDTEINRNVYRLFKEDKEIVLVGTAHVSKESAALVTEVIEREAPDTVCVELCPSRYQTIRHQEKWREMDIVKVIKEKKAFLLLSNLLLGSFQKRIAEKLDIKPGEEMMRAIEDGEAAGARIHLADREIHVTLSRTWRIMGLWEKMKLLFQFLLSLGDVDEIGEEEIEKMKTMDVLQTLLSDVEKTHPVLKEILITERDQYLAEKIRTAPGKKIVAVVGAGHVPGIKRFWDADIDIDALNVLPPKSKVTGVVKWIIPLAIVALVAAGFYYGGQGKGTSMIGWWVAANGILAGLGAVVAFAHPFTILASVVAAPLTSLNPMIAAGWVAGLVEAFSRKPKVADFENLPEDILTVRGFWRNKVTRILLVVVFTNVGSALGTFVAIPMMVNVMNV